MSARIDLTQEDEAVLRHVARRLGFPLLVLNFLDNLRDYHVMSSALTLGEGVWRRRYRLATEVLHGEALAGRTEGEAARAVVVFQRMACGGLMFWAEGSPDAPPGLMDMARLAQQAFSDVIQGKTGLVPRPVRETPGRLHLMDDDAITVVCAEEEKVIKRLATRAEITNYVNAAWEDYVTRCGTARDRLSAERAGVDEPEPQGASVGAAVARAPVNTPSQETVIGRLEELGYMRGHGVLMEKPGAAPGRHVRILVARDGHAENLRTIPGSTV